MISLKKAIRLLPKIDKRWVIVKECAAYKRNTAGIAQLYLSIGGFDGILDLHAAAKTIGYEIYWLPKETSGRMRYVARYLSEPKGYIGDFKTPDLAIQAAFCAAVEAAAKDKGVLK